MKYILFLTASLFASTCFAHGGWKPCVNPPQPVYPEVVVPVQPVQTLTTFVRPHVYYQWTPHYYLKPTRRCFLLPRWYNTYEPVTQWVYQPYYSY